MAEWRFLKKFDKRTHYIVSTNYSGGLKFIRNIYNASNSLDIVKSARFSKKTC